MQSYYFANRQKDTIEITPHFATLVDENEEKYKFQFVFRVLQSAIVKNSLNKVVIKCVNPSVFIDKNSGKQVLSREPAQKFKHSLGQPGLFEIENIQFKHQRQKKLAIAKQNSIIAQTTINLQSFVDSKVFNLIKGGKDPADIEDLYSYGDALELLKDDYYYGDSANLDQNDIRNYNFELISAGIHPAEIVSTQEKHEYANNNLILSLRNYYLNDSLNSTPKESAYYVSTKQKKLRDKIAIRAFVEIPKSLVQNSFEVHFETFKFEKNRNCRLFFTETPVERNYKTVDLLKHLKTLKLQKLSPSISFNEDKLEIKQMDSGSNYLKLEKKEISNTGVCTKYSLIQQGFVGFKDSISAIEPQPDNKFCIFRCVSGESSSTMINPLGGFIVVGKNTRINTMAMVINDRHESNENSIEITIKYPPIFATQFQISKKTWTGSAFGERKIIIPYQYFEGQSTVVLDSIVNNMDIYEYTLEYKTETGETRTHCSQIYEFKRDKSDTEISVHIASPSLTMDGDKPNFMFTVNTEQKISSVDKIQSVSNINSKFLINDVNSKAIEKDSLSNISDTYHHQIVRINLKTGEREAFTEGLGRDSTFGQIVNNVILKDNESSRKINNVSPLSLTTDYLYEVRTFRKNTMTTYKDLIDRVTLPPSSNKSAPRIYYYRPFKWKQHYTKETGTLPALDEKNNLLTRTFIEDGEIGVTASYLLTGLTKLLALNSLSAERVDANKVRLSWKIQGSFDEFDHFVIVKEVNKVRRFIGAALGQELFDNLDHNDVGTIIYYAIPVFYDFSIGVANRSNTILIDPEELDFKRQVSEI